VSAPAVTARAALRDRRFWIHYVQMLVVMLAGMVLLGMLWPHIASVEGMTLVMATNMTVGMTAWMLWRRHGWAPIAEMALAMYLPFVVLFPPYWTGLLPADAVYLVGHVLMLPAMLLAMLARPAEYAGHH
jgi:flagellar biosynthetic protein FliP